jgi:hypothetical protein
MEKTAVEWLYHELNYILPELYSHEWDKFKIAIQQAKEMEKKQIMDAYDSGWSDGFDDKDLNAEYYNETFNNNEK